jgi:hypothetical protein
MGFPEAIFGLLARRDFDACNARSLSRTASHPMSMRRRAASELGLFAPSDKPKLSLDSASPSASRSSMKGFRAPLE